MNQAAATPPRSRAGLTALGVLLVAAWLSSTCTTATDVVARVSAGSEPSAGSSGNQAAGGSADAGGSAGEDAGEGGSAGEGEEACLTYPTVALSGPSSASVCTASLARDRMSHALCACRDLRVSQFVAVDAYRWTDGARTSASGAAVGVNGSFTSNVPMSIDGSLTFGGSMPQAFAGLTVSGDLRLAAEASSNRSVGVGRDLWLGGPLSVSELRVTRDVHLTPSASIQSAGVEEVGGSRFPNSPPIEAPCRCGDDPSFDLAALIEQARLQNDNASIGLAAGVILTNRTLPCGTFFLDSIESLINISLRVTGRAALFVAGDVRTAGRFEVTIEPGAELDWFVLGALDLGFAGGRIGNDQRAGALRIYVGGEGTIDLSTLSFAGNLYAPNSDVSAFGDVSGSIFARDISLLSPLGNAVHYDHAVLTAGDACSEGVVASCSGCGECGAGLACVNGTCSPCASDPDCCAPFVCDAGRCQPLIGTFN